MSPESIKSRFSSMRQKINVLFDYFHGRARGIDVIDHAEKIKRDCDLIFCQMTETRPGCDVDRDLSVASSALISLKMKGSANNGVPASSNAGTLRTMGNVGKKLGKKLGKNVGGKKMLQKFANQNAAVKTNPKHMPRTPMQSPRARRRVRKFAKRILSEEDLSLMNTAVKELGGVDKVSANKCWKQVARRIRTDEELKTQTSASSDIKKIYSSIFGQ